MPIKALLLLTCILLSCSSTEEHESFAEPSDQTELNNAVIQEYSFLACMYADSYFPPFLVDKCKHILIQLCATIEATKPQDVDALYKLTHASTERINDLEDEFFANNSEIETAARECIALDFDFVAKAYDFDADIETLIATRDW